MRQRLFNELDIIIEPDMFGYILTVTNYSGITYSSTLTIDHPSIGNVTEPNLHIVCIRFARTFEGIDYFFANLIYKEQQFDGQLFV
jgi:hypothetical protein